MKRFKNILVVDPRPERKGAFERACILAEKNGAAIKIVEIFDDALRDLSDEIRSKYPIDIEKAAKTELNERLERITSHLKRDDIKITTKILFGTPFMEIIREVLRAEHDLVILTEKREERLKDKVFGTTTMHLMRKCPCPFWVVKPGRPLKYKKILAAVDTGPSKHQEESVNQKVMELAASLAAQEGSKLHIMHCWTQPHEHTLRKGHFALGHGDFEKLNRETRKLHKDRLTAFVGKFNLERDRYQIHLMKGDPGRLIPAQAEKRGIHLIVMGTVSRIGVKGLFIGNTAEKVLSQVNCSVLTVKPDGFVSPVELE